MDSVSAKEMFYNGAPTNQDAENEVRPGDVISDVTNRSELNVVLKPSLPLLEIDLRNENPQVLTVYKEFAVSAIRDMDLSMNGLNGDQDYLQKGLNGYVTEMGPNGSDSQENLISSSMESKLVDYEGGHCLKNGSKISQLTTYLNGSSSNLHESTMKTVRTITVYSGKARCDNNDNLIGKASASSNTCFSENLPENCDEFKSNDKEKNTSHTAECDLQSGEYMDAVGIVGDFNHNLLGNAGEPLNACQSTEVNPTLQTSFKATSGFVQNNGLVSSDMENFDKPHHFHEFEKTDISLSTSHGVTVLNDSTSSNYFKLPTYADSSVKQILRLTDAPEVTNLSMTTKAEEFDSAPKGIFAFNAPDKDLKLGIKGNGSSVAEKGFDDSRTRVRISSGPNKNLGEIEEVTENDEVTQNDHTPSAFSRCEAWFDATQVATSGESSDFCNDITDTACVEQPFANLQNTKESDGPSDQSRIRIIIDDAEAGDSDDSSSSTSEVDFELRAQLLAQINPLLLPPGFVDFYHGGNDVNSDSDDTASNSTGSTITSISQRNDLERVKGLAERLKLNTKRPSFVAWKEQIIDKPYLWRHRVAHQVVNKGIQDDWSSERLNRITEALAWLRSELMDMRVQDQVIAGQLVALRKEIHRVKLEKLTAEHQDMIEDACEMESEKRDELAEIDDAPPDMFSPTLKHFGVTPMNISTRRFSVF